MGSSHTANEEACAPHETQRSPVRLASWEKGYLMSRPREDGREGWKLAPIFLEDNLTRKNQKPYMRTSFNLINPPCRKLTCKALRMRLFATSINYH